jgi:TolB protein
MTIDRLPSPSSLAALPRPSRRTLLAALASTPAIPALAQFRVEVTGVGLTQLPIAIAAFKGEGQAPQKISAIIQADLERSGQFRAVDTAGVQLDETSRPDVAMWRQKSADSLAVGSITRLADGRYDVRFRLWDVVKGQDLGGQGFAVTTGDLRLVAHRISDYIYEKLTGEKGVFSTRIAYVTKSGSNYRLWVADADGENAQSALSSPEPIISPAWSPTGTQLAYVSFESRKPVVYVHDVASGRRRLVANFRGSNSAPAWSPDGNSLAVTLSRDGGSQLYLIGAQGGEPRRLMQSSGIDTEPNFSSDGRSIYFVSDRGGAPQIYKVPASGGSAERVTFTGNYNISPSVSPDGKWLAYVSRVGGGFKLHVMDLATGTVNAITDTTADESPSFAPNSRLIVYATLQQGREALMTTTLDGKIRSSASDVRLSRFLFSQSVNSARSPPGHTEIFHDHHQTTFPGPGRYRPHGGLQLGRQARRNACHRRRCHHHGPGQRRRHRQHLAKRHFGRGPDGLGRRQGRPPGRQPRCLLRLRQLCGQARSAAPDRSPCTLPEGCAFAQGPDRRPYR